MKHLHFLVLFIIAMFAVHDVAAQSVVGQPGSLSATSSNTENDSQKPIRAMVNWMKVNLQLTAQQERELLDFYLNTQIVFNSMDDSYQDPKKEESLAKQEAKLKAVLTAAQLQEFLQRGEEVQNVIMQNLPK